MTGKLLPGITSLAAATLLSAAVVLDRWADVQEGGIVFGLLEEKLGPTLGSRSWFYFEASEVTLPNRCPTPGGAH
jgi:hypothetical protein